MVKSLNERVDKIEEKPLQFVKVEMEILQRKLKMQDKIIRDNRISILALTEQVNTLLSKLATQQIQCNDDEDSSKTGETSNEVETNSILTNDAIPRTNAAGLHGISSECIGSDKEIVEENILFKNTSLEVNSDKAMENKIDNFEIAHNIKSVNLNGRNEQATAPDLNKDRKKQKCQKTIGCNFCLRKFRVPTGLQKHQIQVHQVYQYQQFYYIQN